MTTDYDAIRRSPYYVPPERAKKKKSTRTRGPRKPKVPTAQDKLFTHVQEVLASKGASAERLKGTRASKGLKVRINGKLCRIYRIHTVFRPRPTCPSYARISVSRDQPEETAHIVSVALEGAEEVWYVVPGCVMARQLAESCRTLAQDPVQVLNIRYPDTPSWFETYRDRWDLVL